MMKSEVSMTKEIFILTLAFLGCLYAFLFAVFLPKQGMGAPDVSRGLWCLRNPGVIISIQALWAAMFVYFGRSRVTGSTISLFVDREKI